MGEVWTTDDTSAVAVWVPPGSGELGLGRMLRVGLARMPFRFGMAGSRRFVQSLSKTEPFHKSVEGPHWYLVSIGTHSELQGQGLDVSEVVSDLPSILALDMRSTGSHRNGRTQVGVELRSVTGRLRDQKVRAKARGSWSPGNYRVEGLGARLGEAHIQADGKLDTEWDLDLMIKDLELDQLYPKVAGRLDGKARLTGPRDRPAIQTQFQAADLFNYKALHSGMNNFRIARKFRFQDLSSQPRVSWIYRTRVREVTQFSGTR